MGKVTYLANNGNIIPLDTLIGRYFEFSASVTGMVATIDHIVSQTNFNEEQFAQLIMIKKALQQHAAELDDLVAGDYPFEDRIRKLHEVRPGALTPEMEALLREAQAGRENDEA